MTERRICRLIPLLASLISALAFLSCACADSRPEGYVEVQALRLEGGSAKIRMSAQASDSAVSSDPSRYRIRVRTVPDDATNKKVSYRIPAKYSRYLTVSPDGELEAKDATIENETPFEIPVTVESTTNKKATLRLSVLIENVSVKSVKARCEGGRGKERDRLDLLFNGEPGRIRLEFEPSHAIFGRAAGFRALNENVCEVDRNGVVTPLSVGETDVEILCKNDKVANEEDLVKGFVKVKVSYGAAQYQLETSGGRGVRFRQAIGDYSPLDFSLLILGENAEKDPDVTWYVDTERDPGADDKLQYRHTPSATTPISYRIRVAIRPYQQKEVELESGLIEIYSAFSGFDLEFDNLTSAHSRTHQYGDEVEFAIEESEPNVVKYRWDLARCGAGAQAGAVADEDAATIAETYPGDKNLRRVANATGDFSLKATGLDKDGNAVTGASAAFEFSVEKIVVGDTLVARPKITGEPPGSFHWRIRRAGEEETTRLCDTKLGVPLHYRLTEPGEFTLLVTAFTEGKPSMILKNGEKIPFKFESRVIRAYSEDDEARDGAPLVPEGREFDDFRPRRFSEIRNARIEALKIGDEVRPHVRWDTPEGIPTYAAEVKFGDAVLILDSEKSQADNRGAIFVSNGVLLGGPDLPGPEDDFSIRIKQKNSLYCQTLRYGLMGDETPDERRVKKFVPKIDYPFFEALGDGLTRFSDLGGELKAPILNRYASDMSDLCDVVRFVRSFMPTNDRRITRRGNEFELELRIPFSYDDAKSGYPIDSVDALELYPADVRDSAKIILAALDSLGIAQMPRIERSENGVRVAFEFGNPEPSPGAVAPPSTPTLSRRPDLNAAILSAAGHVASGGIDDDSAIRLPIMRQKSRVFVSRFDTDQLSDVCEAGYLPAFADASASHAVATRIVRRLSAGRSELERIYSFYRFLGQTVAKASDPYAFGVASDAFASPRIATNEALAKAFSVMCNMSGTPCRVVRGESNGVPVVAAATLFGGKRYIVDVARGAMSPGGLCVSIDDFFMLTESEYPGGIALRGRNDISQESLSAEKAGLVQAPFEPADAAELKSEIEAICAEFESTGGTYALELKASAEILGGLDSPIAENVALGEPIPIPAGAGDRAFLPISIAAPGAE